MPNYHSICLNGTCVLENGNYSEPRPEAESRSEQVSPKDPLDQTLHQEHSISSDFLLLAFVLLISSDNHERKLELFQSQRT